MKKPDPKRMMIFCEPCGHKAIIEEKLPPELVTIKSSPIPGGVPQLDPETNMVKNMPSKPQLQKVKCPCCGRGVTVKPLAVPFAKSYEAIDARFRKEKEDHDRKQRIEDGKPVEAKVAEEFLG